MQDLSLNVLLFFFFNDTATTEIYTLSLHDALPISSGIEDRRGLRTLSGPSAATSGCSDDHSHHAGGCCSSASSSADEFRLSIALRCGKRPNRSMISWCAMANRVHSALPTLPIS